MNILIVKLGAIGDIIHTLPALAAIRKAKPEARISWIVEKRSAEILRGNPLLDELIEVDTRKLRRAGAVRLVPGLGGRVRRFKQRRFDLAIDFQGLLKSAAIAKLSGAGQRWGFSRRNLREPASRVFLTNTVQIPDRTHIVAKNLMLAAGAVASDADPTDLEFPIITEASHREEAARIADLTAGRFAILNPAGGWVTKLWPAERYGELADRLWDEHGMASLVTVGPGEDHLGDAVTRASRSGRAIAVNPTLKGFYELARMAEVYVGGDTGPTHLAVAAKAPVVGIFGPTEWWRNGSPDPRDICVERLDIGCRIDCHRRTCSNWICMDIAVETVLAGVRKRLAAGGA